jgi:hypothetical protein
MFGPGFEGLGLASARAWASNNLNPDPRSKLQAFRPGSGLAWLKPGLMQPRVRGPKDLSTYTDQHNDNKYANRIAKRRKKKDMIV